MTTCYVHVKHITYLHVTRITWYVHISSHCLPDKSFQDPFRLQEYNQDRLDNGWPAIAHLQSDIHGVVPLIKKSTTFMNVSVIDENNNYDSILSRVLQVLINY